MSLSPTTNKKEFHVLCYMTLPSTHSGFSYFQTFKFCTGKTYEITGCASALHDGTWWGIAKIPKFENGLGDIGSDKIEFPELTMELYRDSDTAQQSLFDWSDIRNAGYFYEYQADFYLVDSDDPRPKSTNLFFSGRIGKGAVEIEESKCTISLTDRREMDDKIVCRKTFLSTGNVATEWAGKPIPVLLGDWSADVPNSYGVSEKGYYIEAPVTDTDNSTSGFTCQLCRVGEYEVGQVGTYVRWVTSDLNTKGGYTEGPLVVSSSFAATGIFTVDGTEDGVYGPHCIDTTNPDNYKWRDGDKILINLPQGNKDVAGNVQKTPSGIIKHLLLDGNVGLGLSSGTDLDTTSFTNADTICEQNTLFARGWISEQDKTVMDCIGEICREFLFKLVVVNNKYKLVWLPGVFDNGVASDGTIYENQILSWRETGGNDNGITGLSINYRWNPALQKHLMHVPTYISDADADTIDQDHDTIDAYWIYSDECAGNIWSYNIMMRATYVQYLDLELDFSGFDYTPGQKLTIHWQDGNADFLLVNVNHNFEGGKSTLTVLGPPAVSPFIIWAGIVGSAVPEEYGGGSVPANYSLANSDQLAGLSFWAYDPYGSYETKVWSP